MSFYDLLRQPSEAWENIYCNSITSSQSPSPPSGATGLTGLLGGAISPALLYTYNYYFIDDKTVCVYFDAAIDTGSVSTNQLTLSFFPAAIRPSRTLEIPISVANNGVKSGYIQILSTGQATVTNIAGNFTIGAFVGLPGQSFIYTLL
jgi:hypothetical protein